MSDRSAPVAVITDRRCPARLSRPAWNFGDGPRYVGPTAASSLECSYRGYDSGHNVLIKRGAENPKMEVPVDAAELFLCLDALKMARAQFEAFYPDQLPALPGLGNQQSESPSSPSAIQSNGPASGDDPDGIGGRPIPGCRCYGAGVAGSARRPHSMRTQPPTAPRRMTEPGLARPGPAGTGA